MAYYKDLREHIDALEANGKLVRIRREINKDTELMPLVRWQFRGLPEKERKAFLFENVVDVKGKRYDMPVLVASHAASREVYAIGMMCEPDKIMEKWAEAQLHFLDPKIIKHGPVHEEVHLGSNLLEHGGLEEFPIPISTPGFDNAPYITCGNWVTKDPETGVRNMGVYRAMVKSKTRTGILCSLGQHLRTHWEKCKSKGIPLQAAIIIGASPNIGFTGATKITYGVDEYAVASGIAGAPVELVKCKTVDIEVPATAEIVIEGEIPTDSIEREAPFGEFTGYMGGEVIGPYFNITCITHRSNAIFNVFIGQFNPSEESKLKSIGASANWYKFLKYDLNIPDIMTCAFHESGGGSAFLVIQMTKTHPAKVFQALYGATSRSSSWPKIAVVVNEDIDPWDADAVNWALSFRMQPHRDVHIVPGKAFLLDHTGAPSSATNEERLYPSPCGGSALLIDATRKWAYPPVSLPKKQFMERARDIWEEEGLPKLRTKEPWYGYSLGFWTEENEEEAKLALKGEHYQTGGKLARQRVSF